MTIKEKKVIEFNEAEIKTARNLVMIWNKANEYLQENQLKTELDFESFVEKVVNKGEIDVYQQ